MAAGRRRAQAKSRTPELADFLGVRAVAALLAVATALAGALIAAVGTAGSARAAEARPAARLLPHGQVDRVDLGPKYAQADAGILDRPSISADGRWVAFASFARNLVRGLHKPPAPSKDDRQSDVYVRDRQTGNTVLVSATPDGAAGDGGSSAPVLSADGRWVAFESFADNLVPGVEGFRPGVTNVFLRDLSTGKTTLLSGSGGRAGNDDSDTPTIDAHGDRIAFASRADNLVSDDHNEHGDVFVHDRPSGTVQRASLGAGGVELPTGSATPSIDAAGDRVAFILAGTRGGTCEDAYVKDLTTGVLMLATVATDSLGGCGHVEDVALSGDGHRVGFATTWMLAKADHDLTSDVYVRDLDRATTTMVSAPRHPSLETQRGISYGPALSRDGRWVAFTSFADDLGPATAPHTHNAFLADLQTGQLSLIARGHRGRLPAGSSYGVDITPDAAHLAFGSSAQNLVPRQNNRADDAFVLDRSGAQYPAARTPATASVVAPHTEIDVGPYGTVAAGPQRFTLISDSIGVRFQCKFDGGTWRGCGRHVTWTVRPGWHVMRARAVDRSGNADPVPASRVFQAQQSR